MMTMIYFGMMRNFHFVRVAALTGMLTLHSLQVQAAEADEPVFTVYEITYGDEIYNRINGRSYQANENISLEDLRYLQISHYDFAHEVQTESFQTYLWLCH